MRLSWKIMQLKNRTEKSSTPTQKKADDGLSIVSILKVESHNFGIDWSRGAELQRTYY